MNNEKQNDPEFKTGLIDRRFFLKASSATVAVVAAGSVIPALAAENQIPAADNNTEKVPAATGDKNKTNRSWQAGWMAF